LLDAFSKNRLAFDIHSGTFEGDEMPPRLKADLLLLLTSLIWGFAFVAQRIGALELGVYLFNASRFYIGAFLIIGILILSTRGQLSDLKGSIRSLGSGFWRMALVAGGVLFVGSGLQQAGLQYTTAGNAGFITGLYVVIVPFLVRLTGRKVGMMAWVAAAFAVIGLGLLSLGESLFSADELQVNQGDLLELGGAFFWAMHVLIVGLAMQNKTSRSLARAPLLFSAFQFLAAGSLHLAFGLALEAPTLTWSIRSLWALAYVAVFSTAIGYTLQVAGQRHAPETDAALILSLEAVFAALFGYWVLREALLPIQLMGCAIIFGAILLAQIKIRPQSTG
jgi:drug/metabolite transporter (DMT)-like permease